MNRSTSPLLPALALVFLLTPGCGDGGSAGSGEADAASKEPADASAGQSGLERFSITTQTYNAGVKVGLRTRPASSSTVTRYLDGERVAMETRSGNQHQQYYWDGQRGILHDVAKGTVVDQGGVRLRASEPDRLAVASASQLATWGYQARGEKTVLGRPCEAWASQELRSEFCRWRDHVLQLRDFDADGNETGRMDTTEINEGAGIPAEFEALVDRL